ncbi:MAG: histidinol-phosphate transaminase [Pseudomonadota bacterium]
MTRITPQPGILDISPYVSGESTLPGSAQNQITKLSANENPYGPSKNAAQAVRDAAEHLHVYPDSDHAALRNTIAEVEGLDADRVICGAGSDEIISFLCYAYAGPGTQVLYTEHGFSMYPISARAAGAEPVAVPEQNRTADVEALLAAITPQTRLIFLANPNNPTGTMLGAGALADLADGVPDSCLLVLDGAYAEYVPGYDGGASLVDSHDTVVMTRTFSKIHGLGGLRVGWGYGPAHVIDALNRIRGPFNLSAAGIVAAEAAMRDTGHRQMAFEANIKWRTWLTERLRDLGLAVDDSHANFVLPRFDTPATATAADIALRNAGLIVRQVGGYGLPEALRITVGDEIACRRVASVLAEFMGTR